MKHKEIKGNDKYITLDILLKFDSLDKMRITSSESKDKLEISGKELITSLGLKAKVRTQKYKKAVGNLPYDYTSTGPLPRVNTRVNQSGLSLAKPGRAMACATWNIANQGSMWQLPHRII